MKFTTLIPTTWNNGLPVERRRLNRIIKGIWEPFGGMTREGTVTGYWKDGGREFRDKCVKISIACERAALPEAMRRVLNAGRKLRQRAMYFEVSGYDGVQILEVKKEV